MGMVLIFLLMVRSMLDNGSRISNMEWEPFIFRMGTDMKACGIKIINKVKVPCFITMETSILVIGNMINAVELVSISSQMEPHTMVCGQMI